MPWPALVADDLVYLWERYLDGKTDRRGELRQDGQRIFRHYYDLHALLGGIGGGFYK